ncbi:MAG: hypothetical protein ACREJQ_04930 [bacterium]
MTERTHCPICRPTDKALSALAHNTEFSCDACGKFQITDWAAMVVASWSVEQRRNLVCYAFWHYLKKGEPVYFTRENIEQYRDGAAMAAGVGKEQLVKIRSRVW